MLAGQLAVVRLGIIEVFQEMPFLQQLPDLSSPH